MILQVCLCKNCGAAVALATGRAGSTRTVCDGATAEFIALAWGQALEEGNQMWSRSQGLLQPCDFNC